jgi:hypothetical protein
MWQEKVPVPHWSPYAETEHLASTNTDSYAADKLSGNA